ncbi:MAG: signal peptidase II [Chthoniobacterales bacterium]
MKSRSLTIFFPIILLLVALDQLTKLFVLHTIPLYGTIKIVPGFFYLTHLYNTGAAFGMFHDSNRFFIGISLVTLGILVWQQRHFVTLPLQMGWMLLISGILGNVADRCRYGHVIDFLDVQVFSYHWPAFNVADSCICLATVFFLVSSFSPQQK